ncbi:MAG: DUF86 domain-containing protein [Candidatus Hydrogenedentota bacterium]
MPPDLKRLGEEKLKLLLGYCSELEELLAAFVVSSAHRRALERLIQLIVECVADIGFELAAGLGWTNPGSSREAIERAREKGWYHEEAALNFERRYISLHNRIVHDYEKLDVARVRNEAPRLLAAARTLASFLVEKMREESEEQ